MEHFWVTLLPLGWLRRVQCGSSPKPEHLILKGGKVVPKVWGPNCICPTIQPWSSKASGKKLPSSCIILPLHFHKHKSSFSLQFKVLIKSIYCTKTAIYVYCKSVESILVTSVQLYWLPIEGPALSGSIHIDGDSELCIAQNAHYCTAHYCTTHYCTI